MQSVGGKLNFKEIVMSLFPFVSYESSREVPHPDLEIKGGGGVGAVIQTLRPLDKRGAVSQKIFSALRASVWSKNMGRAGGRWSGPRVPPLDLPLPGIMFIVSGENPLHFLLSISTAEGLGYNSEVVK